MNSQKTNKTRKVQGEFAVAVSHLLPLAAAAGDSSSIMLVNEEQLQCLNCCLDDRLQTVE
jgi:hypothetical protein